MSGPPRKGALSIESVSRGHISYVRLYGTVDETFDPTALLDSASGRDIILNLKAVTRLSSFGVRDWVHLMEALRAQADRILLVECSPAVVAQLNMVANFAAGATVASVQAPYFCDQCSWDTEVTVTLTEGETATPLPDVSCKRCNGSMRLDDDAEAYFAFRRGLKSQVMDPSLQKFIDDFSRALDGEAEPRVASDGAPGLSDRAPVPGRLRGTLRHLADLARRAAQWARRLFVAHPRRTVGVSAGFGLVLVALGAFLALRPSGIPPKRLAQLHESVALGQFAKAEELIAAFKREGLLTRELQALLAKQVADARVKLASDRKEAVAAAARGKRYEELVAAANRPVEGVALDLDTLFLVAEAHRQLGHWAEAQPVYGKFETEMLKANAGDKRLDDAVFWQGECALQLGRAELARALFKRVAGDYPHGDFRNSALARLKSLDKK